MKASWDTVKPFFADDGSLRDLLVSPVCESDWNVFLHNLKASRYKFSFSVDAREMSIPFDIKTIRKLQLKYSTKLEITLFGNDTVNCYFFPGEEAEFDICPKAISTAQEFSVLVEFMQFLKTAFAKPALLTLEGSPESVICSVR